jgi:hypothetical protein
MCVFGLFGFDFGGETLGVILVILGVTLLYVGAGQPYVDPHRADMADLVRAHLVGDHQDQLVTLLRGDQAEPEAGIAGGGLDDGSARLDLAFLLGGLDHADGDAVLDRSARILGLHLDVQFAGAGVEFADLENRRVAYQFEY